MKTSIARQVTAGVLYAAMMTGCGPGGSAHVAQTGMDPGVAAPFETERELLRELHTIPHLPADGVSGPNGTLFYVHDRVGEVTQYPCTSCHTAIPKSDNADVVSRRMHNDILLKHAGADVMTCSTCHDSEFPNDLVLLGGGRISMQTAYRQCAQCHSQQAADWAGGAHGKRLVGWQGLRVINNCADCHDPHNPAIPHRQPAAGPRFSHER
jgi:hypothetical protein